MALIVEDGTVVANADSYVTLAAANAYFATDVVFDSTWAALSDADKEQYIKWATRILDQKVDWKGTRTSSTSSLRWPRTDVYDRDEQLIGKNTIPPQLREAVYEMIKFLVAGNNPTTSIGADYLSRIKADVVEIEYQPGAMQHTGPPPLLNQILRGLGAYPSANQSHFAKIVKV